MKSKSCPNSITQTLYYFWAVGDPLCVSHTACQNAKKTTPGITTWTIVTEFMAKGDLSSVIHSDQTLSILQLFQFALDIASGMAWLTGQTVQSKW
jgi:hypothetical protein